MSGQYIYDGQRKTIDTGVITASPEEVDNARTKAMRIAATVGRVGLEDASRELTATLARQRRADMPTADATARSLEYAQYDLQADLTIKNRGLDTPQEG